MTDSLEGLDKHGASVTRPAFLRVEKQPLQATVVDMCQYKQAAATVLDIGDSMVGTLQSAHVWTDKSKVAGHANNC